MNNTAYIVSQ